jgi:hypothetical protein
VALSKLEELFVVEYSMKPNFQHLANTNPLEELRILKKHL